MKKLYFKAPVHPSPPLISDHLALLPATILTLTAALSLEDREVLAYLLSCSSDNFFGNRRNIQKSTGGGGSGGKGVDHPPSFNCGCFSCYMSYWVRWDSSPNRQLIHEIIDVFEDGLWQSKKNKNKKERRKRGCNRSDELRRPELISSITQDEFDKSESAEKTIGGGAGVAAEKVRGSGSDDEGEEQFGKGSVRKLVNFIGERIWSVWT